MSLLPDSTIYVLKQAELAVRGCVEIALARFDLTPNQMFVLILVESGEATSSAELARAIGVMPQSMTDVIAPLEKRGAIRRRPDAANRRILRIELTEAGQRLLADAGEAGARLERELTRHLSGKQLEELNGALAELRDTALGHAYHPAIRRTRQGG